MCKNIKNFCQQPRENKMNYNIVCTIKDHGRWAHAHLCTQTSPHVIINTASSHKARHDFRIRANASSQTHSA